METGVAADAAVDIVAVTGDYKKSSVDSYWNGFERMGKGEKNLRLG